MWAKTGPLATCSMEGGSVSSSREIRCRMCNSGAMALPETGKLVRDRIPLIIQDSGRQPRIVTISEDDLRAALEMKLGEEVDELLAAPEESRLEELADIYEVLLALARNVNATERQLHQMASDKRNKRGAFDNRSWLIDTGDR